ncbi:MAG: UvrD-helicase domain-containing protein [Actinobacteria bacterium]|nr:UvrD-helicase domain-containing protein [Actinomycetota bacterium]
MTETTPNLNPAQADAVNSTDGPLLVLAGAGSGKTKVLTHRIAHIVSSGKASPEEIIAITFTNKAAAEMKARLGAICGLNSRNMWVMTFHAMCVRMLRIDAERVGYTSRFTIYDADDSKRLFKAAMTQAEVDEKRYPVAGVANRTSSAKNELIDPEEFAASAITPMDKAAARVFPLYQRRLKESNAMDFDDLLVEAHRLLADHPDVLDRYQSRFRYVLVDEYQDTNHAQYRIVKLLAERHRNLMVVGDDDQSIYSWRGADIRNILDFEQDYPETNVIRLEQNYRSTATILAAANAVVANNLGRKTKTLWTANAGGEAVTSYKADDERDEARFIAREIERLRLSEGHGYSDFAVFYRTNAQSRTLEDALLREGIPYQIVGGTRYFDRAEVRDVMAYLKILINPLDAISIQRIINRPRRGIGKTTVDRIAQISMDDAEPFETTLRRFAAGDFGTGPAAKVRPFVELIDEIRAMNEHCLRDQVEKIIDRTGLLQELANEGTVESSGRAENIREFFGVAEEYSVAHPQSPEDGADIATQLADFVEWLALRSDLDSMSGDQETVTLMTVHTAKGLEFPVVFIAGLEDTLFPHVNSIFDPAGLEEERRLAYVAITRARERLYLTHARNRSLFGSTRSNPPSRFIAEIPRECLKADAPVRTRSFSSGAVSAKPTVGVSTNVVFQAGDRVEHKVFGIGVVKQVSKDRVTVDFGSKGVKNLMTGFAPLRKLAS